MSDATLWAERGPVIQRRARVWDPEAKAWINPTDELGRPVMERVPQTGKVGLVRVKADIATLKNQRERRFLTYLHHDGNICNDTIRSAAASVPGTDASLELYVRQKAKALGWLLEGCCPVDEVLRRERSVQQMASSEVRADIAAKRPCPVGEYGPGKPPCKHFIAEDAARKARRAKESDLRELRAKSNTEIQAEKQTAAMVDLASELRATAAATTAAPAPKGSGK